MNLVALPGGIGRLEQDGSVSELDLPHPSVASLLSEHGGPAAMDAAGACGTRGSLGLQEVTGASMLAPGAVVWGVGLNYRSKQLATGRPRPDEPVLFAKASSSFTGTGSPICVPAAAPECVDYEGEIAVMIGSHLDGATVLEAAEGVAGYLAANDVTARDVMRSSGNPTLAKSFRGFGQLGNAMACVHGAAALEAIPLSTRVNGDLRQQDDSDGMLLSVAELLALLSRYVLLRPGDVVLTGTPAGTGDETGRYLAPGDTVEVKVGNLPALVSDVTAPASRLSDMASEVPA